MQETVTAQSICEIFDGAGDFQSRSILSGTQELQIFFLDGLCAANTIAEQIIRPLTDHVLPGSMEEVFQQAQNGAIWSAAGASVQTAREAAEKLVNGFAVICFDGLPQALCFEVRTPEKRAPSPPESESTIKGAKDAFTETMRTNTSLIRRHLRTPDLRLYQTMIGTRSLTSVTLAWVKGLTDPELVDRMQKRLGEIEIDGLISPASVEEYVSGSRASAFPLLEYTERTDKFCQGLLAGRVGLLVDGLPLGYLAPVSLAMLMRSQEDRAVDYVSASCIRVLRYLALFLSLLLPAVYVAMASFHQQMIPTSLLLAIIESKKSVPFSTFLEILALLAAFELLQEAGLHLPQAIGTAVSIIGGLVVGSAAVEANLVSPAALIITASSGICGFTLPSRDLSDAIRVWRFFLVVLAGVAGLFGVSVGLLLLLIHLAGLSSLGLSYLSPFSGAKTGDTLLRRRLAKQTYRDPDLHPQDERNQR